ncbi:MAG: efflux RND transporter periplasmic adaptor subunit [Planctomycetota bacterium]
MSSTEEVFALDESDPSWVSVSDLQCQLRAQFATRPAFRAAATALESIAQLLQADYAVVHACVSSRPLSEEWSRPGFALREALREHVNAAMIKSLELNQSSCVRLTSNDGETAVVMAVLYDGMAEQIGSIGLVFRHANRAHAYEVLVQLESLAGFLSLLLSDTKSANTSSVPDMLPGEASDPNRLMLRLASELTQKHGLDQIALGIVERGQVQVLLVNSDLDMRASNPGVTQIREAMTECLDLEIPIRANGDEREPSYRLHEAWRNQRGSGTVASMPLAIDDKTVAILSAASSGSDALPEAALRNMQAEAAAFAPLLPLTRLASRSLREHVKDTGRSVWRRLRARKRRLLFASAAALATASWLLFGTLEYHLTVPCVVAAREPRTIACPRDGVLSELYVRPGDRVRRGQLLAELDSHDDQLSLAELESEAIAIDAQMDVALGEHNTGELRVIEAQRDGLSAKIAIVSKRIERAEIRSPLEGVILAGELREQLGARLAMGDALFEVARFDGGRIEMRIPEQHVLDAQTSTAQSFRPHARPDVQHELSEFRLSPASSVKDGKNVFVAEALVDTTVAGMPPGMEGFAIIDVGRRSALWVLSHRLVDWLRLNFWL